MNLAFSFRTKVVLVVVSIVILTGSFGIVVTKEVMVAALKKGLEERAVTIATSLAIRVADPILQGQFFELHTIIQEARSSSRNADVRYIIVLDPKGNLVDHSFEEGVPSDLLTLARPASGQEYTSELLETEGEVIRNVSVPVLDGRAGYLHIGVSQSTIDAAVNKALTELATVAAAALLAGAALSWMLASMAASPIFKLVRVAEAVKEGDLAQRAHVAATDEIGRLANAFDAMTEQLVVRIRDLETTTRQVAALNKIAVTTAKTADLKRMFANVLDETIGLLSADGGAILSWDERQKANKCIVQQGLTKDYVERLEGIPLPRRDTSFGCNGTYAEETPADLMIAGVGSVPGAKGMILAMSVPFAVKGEVRGELHLVRKDGRPFGEKEEQLLAGVAAQIGIALENLELISEAEQAAALRELNRLRSEFIARASHELRTPVTAIRGYVETLLRPDMDLSQQEEQQILEDIDDVSDRLIRLIEDLLNLSRLEAGHLAMRSEKVALRPLIQKVIRRYSRQTRRHSFRLEVRNGVNNVLGDADRIEDVLDNLLSNAVKYSPKGGTITVAVVRGLADGDEMVGGVAHRPAWEGAHWVTVSVIDEGIGIPPDRLPELFRQFSQVSTAGVRSSGIGIGLYICKSYIEAMGGRIWVRSDGEKKGATFSFALPSDPSGEPRNSSAPIDPISVEE